MLLALGQNFRFGPQENNRHEIVQNIVSPKSRINGNGGPSMAVQSGTQIWHNSPRQISYITSKSAIQEMENFQVTYKSSEVKFL